MGGWYARRSAPRKCGLYKMESTVALTTLIGDEVFGVLEAVANLRISVFAEWPYCYRGSLDYERKYLQSLANSQDAVVVVAREGDRIVGASTGMRLTDAPDASAADFASHGYELARGYYFGESVLLPAFRGQGLGVGFFAHRLHHAQRCERYDFATFCAVVRAPDDPRRPTGWLPLDDFWRARGFAPVPGLECQLSWTEHGNQQETTHRMQFWARLLLAD